MYIICYYKKTETSNLEFGYLQRMCWYNELNCVQGDVIVIDDMKPWHGKKVEDLQKNDDDTKVQCCYCESWE
jgi:hypothetical protein